MSLGGKREAAGYHCIFIWKKMPKEAISKVSRTNLQSSSNLAKNLTKKQSIFRL
jgi:hypothetical protein